MRTETNRSTALREQIEALRHMTVGQLKDKYRDVFGELDFKVNSTFASPMYPQTNNAVSVESVGA